MSMAKGLLPDNHPQSASAARSFVLAEADAVMLVGARLNWLLAHGKGKTWGKDPKKFIQIDIQANEVDSNVQIAAPLIGDIGSCVGELLKGISAVPKPSAEWIAAITEKKEKNTIVHSFNRNFQSRNDGNPNTYAFVGSPELVTALAIAGDLSFNPLTDTLVNEKGQHVKLDPPSGEELPKKGFSVKDAGYQAPAKDGSRVKVSVSPKSDRLQLLSPFKAWEGEDLKGLRLLIKAKGKCTTDHISMAGKWLKYRGHLDNISNNLLIGATNFFNEKINSVKNNLTGAYDEVPNVHHPP